MPDEKLDVATEPSPEKTPSIGGFTFVQWRLTF